MPRHLLSYKKLMHSLFWNERRVLIFYTVASLHDAVICWFCRFYSFHILNTCHKEVHSELCTIISVSGSSTSSFKNGMHWIKPCVTVHSHSSCSRTICSLLLRSPTSVFDVHTVRLCGYSFGTRTFTIMNSLQV